jgi:hypothetical protein
MTPISVRSGLAAFCMLDAICRWNDKTIAAVRTFYNAPGFAAIEACAQVCALHVRRRSDFGGHAFLLSVSSVTPLPPERLHGRGRLEAVLLGVSRRAFTYAIEMNLSADPLIQVVLTIGTMDFGETFAKDLLRPHYRRLFSSLNRQNKRDALSC